MKHSYIIIIFLLCICFGCIRRKSNIITFNLKHSVFLETIETDGTVQAVNNNVVVTPRVYSSLQVARLVKEGSFVRKGDTICVLAAPDLINTFEQFKTELQKMEGAKDSIEADQAMQLSLLEAQVETNKAQMEITMLDSIQLKFASAVKQKLINLEMEKVKIEKMKLEKKLAAQKKISSSELQQIGSRIMIQKNRIQIFQGQINSLYIVAPSDGFVIHAETPTFYTSGGSTIGGKIEEGSKVFSSMPLLQIPENGRMQVSVEVPEADYKRINNDQKVGIKIVSVSNHELTGKVVRKSLATKNRDEKSAIKSYEVIISVDSCDSSIKPGLGASCSIIINEVKETIIVPSAAIFTKDSTKIVYVSKGRKFLAVIIETGFSNNSESIVSKGLMGNETIALMEPPYSLIFHDAKRGNSVKKKSSSSIRDMVRKDSINKIVTMKKHVEII
ncbi:MAG: HlyD family efflux transporter periplasmic adaptor subunit [Bacteroidales bacterium]